MRSRQLHHSSMLQRTARTGAPLAGAALALTGTVVLLLTSHPAAFAIGTAVELGTVSSYSVLGGQSVSNTGPSVLSGDLGTSPGNSITGFPPGQVLGAIHPADAPALQAQSDLVIAFNDAAGQAADENVPNELGGLTLPAGVYNASSSALVTGTLTLDAEGDPDAVFIFQIGSTLTTAPSSTIALINGAQGCNVFWQVGSSATLDTATVFVGTLLVLTSITINAGTTVQGRALARNGSVTLDSTQFTDNTCQIVPPTSSSPTPNTGLPTLTTTGGPTGPVPSTVPVPSTGPSTSPPTAETTPIDSQTPPVTTTPTPGLTAAPPSTPQGSATTSPTGSSSAGGPGGPRPPGHEWSPPGGNGNPPPQLSLTGSSIGPPTALFATGTIVIGLALIALGARRPTRERS